MGFRNARNVASDIATLQEIKGYFNPARVISVAASLPKNVHTSRSIISLHSCGFTAKQCAYKQINYIVNRPPFSDNRTEMRKNVS